MDDGECVKRMSEGTILRKGGRGRPQVKWINRLDEYWRRRSYKVKTEGVRKECLNSED